MTWISHNLRQCCPCVPCTGVSVRLCQFYKDIYYYLCCIVSLVMNKAINMWGVCFSKKQSVMETLQSQEAGMTVGLYWGTFLKSVSVCNIYQNNAPVLHHDIVLGLIQFHRFPLVTLVCLCVCVWGKVSSSPLLTEGQPRVWFLQLHPECVCFQSISSRLSAEQKSHLYVYLRPLSDLFLCV